MFKLVVLSVLFAVVVARPGYVSHLDSPLVYGASPLHQEYVEIQEPTVHKVGAIIESVPSAVSHQSLTVVHSHAHVVTPVLAHGVQTYHVPAVRTYATPVVYDFEGGHHDYHHHY